MDASDRVGGLSHGQAAGPGSEAMLEISWLWPGRSSCGPRSSPANPAPTHAHRVSWDPFLLSSLFLKGFNVNTGRAASGRKPGVSSPLPEEWVLDTSIYTSDLRLLPMTDTKLRWLTWRGWSRYTLCLVGLRLVSSSLCSKEDFDLVSLLPLPPECLDYMHLYPIAWFILSWD